MHFCQHRRSSRQDPIWIFQYLHFARFFVLSWSIEPVTLPIPPNNRTNQLIASLIFCWLHCWNGCADLKSAKESRMSDAFFDWFGMVQDCFDYRPLAMTSSSVIRMDICAQNVANVASWSLFFIQPVVIFVPINWWTFARSPQSD